MSHLPRVLRGLGVALLAVPASTTPQQTPSHHVRVRVSDVAEAAAWYSEALGFSVRSLDRFPSGRTLAYLDLGEARIILEDDPEQQFDGHSGVVKLGLLLPDLASAFERLSATSPEGVLQPISELPPSTVPDWPTTYFLASGPDGLLIQGFQRERDVPFPR